MKKIIGLVFSIVLLIGMPIRPAAALSGEKLGCWVVSGQTEKYTSPGCFPTRPKFSYNVVFRVLNISSTYTYSWNTTGWPAPLVGCTSTSEYCTVRADASLAAMWGVETNVAVQGCASSAACRENGSIFG